MLEVVEKLLAAGADPNLKDHQGRTAQSMASDGGHEQIETLLRSRK
jgi:ankyrin repeat protein